MTVSGVDLTLELQMYTRRWRICSLLHCKSGNHAPLRLLYDLDWVLEEKNKTPRSIQCFYSYYWGTGSKSPTVKVFFVGRLGSATMLWEALVPLKAEPGGKEFGCWGVPSRGPWNGGPFLPLCAFPEAMGWRVLVLLSHAYADVMFQGSKCNRADQPWIGTSDRARINFSSF